MVGSQPASALKTRSSRDVDNHSFYLAKITELEVDQPIHRFLQRFRPLSNPEPRRNCREIFQFDEDNSEELQRDYSVEYHGTP